MKFVMSYSCGKDSTLALHRLIKAGHEPAGLLVMVNRDIKRSWFHGADDMLLEKFQNPWRSPCSSARQKERTIIWNLKKDC